VVRPVSTFTWPHQSFCHNSTTTSFATATTTTTVLAKKEKEEGNESVVPSTRPTANRQSWWVILPFCPWPLSWQHLLSQVAPPSRKIVPATTDGMFNRSFVVTSDAKTYIRLSCCRRRRNVGYYYCLQPTTTAAGRRRPARGPRRVHIRTYYEWIVVLAGGIRREGAILLTSRLFGQAWEKMVNRTKQKSPG
jgi:hypothetical protein